MNLRIEEYKSLRATPKTPFHQEMGRKIRASAPLSGGLMKHEREQSKSGYGSIIIKNVMKHSQGLKGGRLRRAQNGTCSNVTLGGEPKTFPHPQPTTEGGDRATSGGWKLMYDNRLGRKSEPLQAFKRRLMGWDLKNRAPSGKS